MKIKHFHLTVIAIVSAVGFFSCSHLSPVAPSQQEMALSSKSSDRAPTSEASDFVSDADEESDDADDSEVRADFDIRRLCDDLYENRPPRAVERQNHSLCLRLPRRGDILNCHRHFSREGISSCYEFALNNSSLVSGRLRSESKQYLQDIFRGKISDCRRDFWARFEGHPPRDRDEAEYRSEWLAAACRARHLDNISREEMSRCFARGDSESIWKCFLGADRWPHL